MKTFSLSFIKGVFDMFIAMFKETQGLSKDDKPWQEWVKFFLFCLLTFIVMAVGFYLSIEIITGPSIIEGVK